MARGAVKLPDQLFVSHLGDVNAPAHRPLSFAEAGVIEHLQECAPGDAKAGAAPVDERTKTNVIREREEVAMLVVTDRLLVSGQKSIEAKAGFVIKCKGAHKGAELRRV